MHQLNERAASSSHVPALSLANREQAEAFTRLLNERQFDYLRFEMADMAGLSRGKTVPTSQVAAYLRRGLNINGVAVVLDSGTNLVPGTGYGEERHFGDCVMVSDPATLSAVPWLENTGRVICDPMWYDGTVQMAAPRLLLRKVLAIADSHGYLVKMGHEYEFYLLDAKTREPIFTTKQPIFASRCNHQIPAIDELLRVLAAQGIQVITHNVEHGPGQIEINYEPLSGVAAADCAFVFKNSVKEFLARRGLLATLMSKPFAGRAGSGSHFNVSLLDRRSGSNAFLDTGAKNGLSRVAESFIQGVLDHAPGAMALCNPTPNCYRRIQPGSFAPYYVSWGIQDRRATSVRVKATGDEATHIELRVPSALSNPYLVAAVTIAAGLSGIERERELVAQGSGPSCPQLPSELNDALRALQADDVLCALLGDEFIRAFVAIERFEYTRLHNEIPAAELNEYLEYY